MCGCLLVFRFVFVFVFAFVLRFRFVGACMSGKKLDGNVCSFANKLEPSRILLVDEI